MLKFNVDGGCIAIGHPLGATGAILAGTLLDEMERSGLRWGVAASSVWLRRQDMGYGYIIKKQGYVRTIKMAIDGGTGRTEYHQPRPVVHRRKAGRPRNGTASRMGHRITVVPPDKVRPSVALGRIMVSHLESLQGQGGGRPLAKMVPSPLPWPVTPQVNIKEVALMQRPLSPVIDEAHLWKQERGLPADNKQLMMVLSDSAIAKFPYRKNQKNLERVHNTAVLNAAILQGGIPKFAPLGEDAPEFKALLKAAQNTTTAKLSQRLKAQDGLLVDKKSGLVIALFKDEESGQIKIAFGGTKSGKNLKSRKRISGGQIQADIKNFTSLGLPRAYKQAAEFSRLTAELFGADMVSLTGHSLGAGLAQYSAAMNKLPANCFSPAALGKAALKELAANNRLDPDWLKQNIHHYMVKGDPVCNPKGMSWFHRNFSATNLGTRVIIRPQVDKYKGMVASHNHSHEHLEKAVKRRLRMEARAVKSSESD